MSEWQLVQIKEIADVIGGGTPSTTNNEFWNGDIPWITPRDLTGYTKTYISQGDRSISKLGLEKSSAKLLPENTILLTSRAPIGYVAIAKNEIATNQGFKSLVLDSKRAESIFIYYWVKANIEYIQSLGTGTTFAEISGSVVKDIEINLPPLLEQKAIADVLSSLDDKIDLLQRQNKTLEKMAETLFRQWFIEEAKEDWEELPLSSIATFTNGLACQKFPPQKGEMGLPVLKIKELSAGITESSDRATEDVKKEYIVHHGDIIFAWSASLMVKIWPGEKCVLNQHLFNVKSDSYPKWFYYEWSKYYLNEFKSIAESHATTMGHIKRKDLDDAMVKIPSDFELEKMNQFMIPNLEKIILNLKQIQSLQNLRDTLLPKLMNGEVRVKLD